MRIKRHSRIEATIQETNLNYQGSITIPQEFMEDNDILEGEQVHVLNKNNGGRFITYAIPGDRVCLNGAAARQGKVGDEIIILTYHII